MEKIIEALEVIKKECEETEDCCICRLGTKDDICILRNKIPQDWKITKPTEIERLLK